MRPSQSPVISRKGKGRGTQRDYRHFLMQARGSLYELETDIDIASELSYLPANSASELLDDCNELARILNGLINSLR